jgi:6-phosphofructokinase 1
MQQGGSPSPFDRNFGTEMAAKATVWLVEKAEANLIDGQVVTNDPETAVLLGLCKKTLQVLFCI